MRTIVAVALLSLASTTVDARDRWIGEWAGNCGQDVQCSIAIAPTRAGYAISWVVADRMDAAKVLCRVDATALKNAQRLTFGDAPGYTIGMVGGGAAIAISGTGTRGDDLVDCAGRPRKLPGTYSAIGD